MSIDPKILQAALAGFEAQKARLDQQIASIKATLGGRSATFSAPNLPAQPEARAKRKYTKRGAKKRSLSPEARERIAAAQKKRWEAHRKAKG